SLGWIFLGDAIRMAQGHGLHRNDVLQYSDIVERETRRRLWWTLYEFERYYLPFPNCSVLISDSGVWRMGIQRQSTTTTPIPPYQVKVSYLLETIFPWVISRPPCH